LGGGRVDPRRCGGADAPAGFVQLCWLGQRLSQEVRQRSAAARRAARAACRGAAPIAQPRAPFGARPAARRRLLRGTAAHTPVTYHTPGLTACT
jgi:hypothetical protein